MADGESAGAAIRSVARGGSINLAGTVATAAAQLGITLIVTRSLSKESAGVFFSVTSLFLIASVFGNLGSNTGLVYFIARARALSGPQTVQAYMRAAVVPVLVVGLALATVLWVFAPRIGAWTNPAHASDAAHLVRTLAVFIPIASIENIVLAATRGAGTMRAHAIVELLSRPMLQLALVLLASLLWPSVLALSWAAPYVPAAVAAILWWRVVSRRAGFTRGRREQVLQVNRSFWAFSLPRWGTSIIQVAAQRLDIILVGAIAGAASAAIYTAATRFVVVGQLGNNALTMAAQPSVAAAVAQKDTRRLRELYTTSTGWLILLSWPVYLLLLTFAERILSIFGSGYGSGATTIVVLVVAMLVSSSFGMVDTMLAMAGRTAWNLGNALLALAVQIGLDLLLIPQWGILGAAVGWACAIVVRNVAALIQVYSTTGLHPFAASTLLPAVFTAVAFGLVPVVVAASLGRTWAALLVSVLIGSVVHALTVRRLRERLHLSEVLPKRRSGVRQRPHRRPR